jgi:hypothetical protein
MLTDKKEDILVALRTVYPVPQDFITEVENINDTFVDALHKTWMGFTKEDWLRRRPNDGDAIYNALHANQGMQRDSVILTNCVVGSLSRTSSESTVELGEIYIPHPARKRRWEQLNAILLANKKYKLSLDSTAYSYVEWKDVKEVFSIVDYVQATKPVPDDVLATLTKYLTLVTKCFGSIRGGKEAKLLHFIAPIIVCVCYLFNGDVVLECEENLNGDFVKAHGHFEFVLRRGNRRVCIVEAKKDDMDQGLAQDLLGCEVAADVGKTDKVYGIVTNYIGWFFLRSFDEKIECEVASMEIANQLPVPASLAKIAGKIYAMLSDE